MLAMPVFSSAQRAEQLPETLARLGSDDLMYLSGGGIMGHPMGIAAGVASIREALEAARAGIDLVEYAADHPALQRARAELAAARARARGQPRPPYNPAIELGYENALDNTREVGLSQTLDISGKRGARARVAQANLSAAQARLAITRKALLGELLGALANYETARRALDLARTRVRLDQDFLALAEKRGRAGDLPQSELLTARLSLAGARAQESAADAAFSQTQERLLAVTALAPPARPLLEGPPPAAPAAAGMMGARHFIRRIDRRDVRPR